MWEISDQKKHQYWNHFIEQWVVDGMGSGHSLTGLRLRKVKPIIWDDENFWDDIIMRHNALDHSPEHLRQHHPTMYAHCIGNFWGMVTQTMVEEGILR